MEEKLRQAIVEELRRQAEDSSALTARALEDGVEVHGRIDLDALVMVVAGAMAGGP